MRILLAAGVLLAAALPVRAQEAVPQPEVGKEFILLRTNMGDLLLALYPKVAPNHCAQILKLARLGVFDTFSFTRVIRGFVAQVSDHYRRELPLTPSQAAAIRKMPRELSQVRHVRGVLSMAHNDPPDVDDAETSFSIMLGEAPHLDNEYTVFGRLEKGQEVLDAIEAVDVANEEPRTRIMILTVDVIDTVEEYDKLDLRGPLYPPAPPPATVIDVSNKNDMTGGLGIPAFILVGLMMLSGFLTFVLAGKLSPRVVGAIGLVTVLVGFFFVWVVLVPAAHKSRTEIAGIFLFIGAICLFKLMNKFESPR